MNQKRSLTQNGINTQNFIFILISLAMVVVSIYLTTHFYDTLYPTRLGGSSSICNISNFFNCDAATYSKISNIAGIPISFFGILVGLLFLVSALMPSEALERTSSAVAKYNFIGCVILFIFSLAVLGNLCPMCTLYYVLSGAAFFLFHKYGERTWAPDGKTSAIWGVILVIGSFFFFQTTAGKEDTRNKINQNIVEQYRKLPTIGEADVESPFKIHMSTPKFNDAPIRLTVFSDFECPFCKVVADQMPELLRRYKDKMNIQYMFYPLDAKCNSNVKGNFHKHACEAAMIAACDDKKFAEVHDEIFANQAKFPDGVLQDIAKKHDLKGCGENPEILAKVVTAINQGTKFNLKSTPTIILNGKKIEGTIPSAQFFAIFEDILNGQK